MLGETHLKDQGKPLSSPKKEQSASCLGTSVMLGEEKRILSQESASESQQPGTQNSLPCRLSWLCAATEAAADLGNTAEAHRIQTGNGIGASHHSYQACSGAYVLTKNYTTPFEATRHED